MRPAITRFREKYVVAENGCWTWTAGANWKGYGQFKASTKRKVGAHRWAYEHFVGPIPTGLQVDHLCRNRRCVNPAHLEPVTHRENQLRGDTALARSVTAPTCSKGHEWTQENTYRRKRGDRMCLACHLDRQARYAANPSSSPPGEGGNPAPSSTNLTTI